MIQKRFVLRWNRLFLFVNLSNNAWTKIILLPYWAAFPSLWWPSEWRGSHLISPQEEIRVEIWANDGSLCGRFSPLSTRPLLQRRWRPVKTSFSTVEEGDAVYQLSVKKRWRRAFHFSGSYLVISESLWIVALTPTPSLLLADYWRVKITSCINIVSSLLFSVVWASAFRFQFLCKRRMFNMNAVRQNNGDKTNWNMGSSGWIT